MKKKIKKTTVFRDDLIARSLEGEEFDWKSLKYGHSVFDEAGNVIVDLKFDDSGEVEEKYEYVYNDKGQMIERREYFDEHQVAETTVYQRDENGRIIRNIHSYQEGTPDTTAFIYNNAGLLTEANTVDEEGETVKRETTEYDNGKPVRRASFIDGELVRKEELQYGENGSLAQTTTWNMEEESSVTSRYNEAGMVIETKQYDYRNVLISAVIYTYNDKGKVSEIVEEGARAVNITRITYDEHGNAVKQEETDDEGNVLHTVERTFNENNDVTETSVLIDLRGRGINRHYIMRYEYEYF